MTSAPRRMLGRSLRLLLLVAAAAIGLSQSEDEPYFALSSSQTFGANGQPKVSLNAWHVDSLAFRVYRINDPVKFFAQLEDPHQFGGNVRQPPQDRTLLERLHIWKRSLHAQIRRALRAQFTEQPSAFRVYRINDPVKFFAQLEDPHQFGGNVRQPPQDRTLLERLHIWKRSLHAFEQSA